MKKTGNGQRGAEKCNCRPQLDSIHWNYSAPRVPNSLPLSNSDSFVSFLFEVNLRFPSSAVGLHYTRKTAHKRCNIFHGWLSVLSSGSPQLCCKSQFWVKHCVPFGKVKGLEKMKELKCQHSSCSACVHRGCRRSPS